MGKCPHCGYTGKANIETISKDYEGTLAPSGDTQFTGQLVCPDCDMILGGISSATRWKDNPI